MMPQFGILTLKNLTTNTLCAIKTWLISLPQGSLASHSALQEKTLASKTKETAGRKPLKPFASYDHDMHCWRTSQVCLLTGTLDEYSETWPKAGMMQNGALYPQRKLERRTSEKGFGYIPTATATDQTAGKSRMAGKFQKYRGIDLATYAATWPTPNTLDSLPPKSKEALYKEATITRPGRSRPTNLRDAINNMQTWKEELEKKKKQQKKLWPTPRRCDYIASKTKTASVERRVREGKATTAEAVVNAEGGGTLNPTWVSLLMGWPMNSTCLNPISKIEYNKWLMGNIDAEDKRAGEALSELQSANAAQEIRQAFGGLLSLDEAKVLQSVMCEYSQGFDETRLQLESQKAFKKVVRKLQVGTSATSSSHRPKHKEQRPSEHSNPLQVLSRLLAQYGKKAWQDGSWENGTNRIATGVANRVDRIKALGNGQVPAVVVEAWKRLTDNS